MKKIFLFIYGLILCWAAYAQSGPDSLRALLGSTPDSLRAPLLIDLAEREYELAASDSALVDSALEHAWAGLRLANVWQDTAQIVRGLYHLYYQHPASLDSARRDSILDRMQFFNAYWGYPLRADDESFPNFNNAYRFVRIFHSLFVYADSLNQLGWDRIRKMDWREHFVRNTHFNFQADSPWTYWLRLRLRGNSRQDGRYLLSIGHEAFTWDTIDIYLLNDRGEVEHLRTGKLLDPKEKTAVQDGRSMFYVDLAQNEEKVMYARLRGMSTHQQPFGIYINQYPSNFLTHTSMRLERNLWVFFGILSAMGLYFLLLYLSTGERSYFPYLIYILGLMLCAFVAIQFPYYFPKHLDYSWFPLFFTAWVAGAGLLWFSQRYLNVHSLLPRWLRVSQVFLVVFSIPPLFFVCLFVFGGLSGEHSTSAFGENLIEQLAQILILFYFLMFTVGLILIATLGILALRKGYSPAKYFLIAVGFLVLSVGIIPLFILFEWFFLNYEQIVLLAQGGIILQLCFFSLGVGHKLKLLEGERAEALEKNLNIQREANEKLRQADKLKDEFLANTSHELRTPLNGIIGLSESLYEQNQDPAQKEQLSLIMASGRRLNSLVNDLLDFSKLKNFELQLQPRALDLRAVCEVVLTLNQRLTGSKNLRLLNSIPADCPQLWADENRLQQILHNLIGNAIKFTEAGEVKVGIADTSRQAPHNGQAQIAAGNPHPQARGKMLTFYVSDTGIGIPPEKQSLIFEQFQQGDGSTARLYGGTGLGLSITRQLVELHGGKIWVESEMGKGSVFYVSLPIATDAQLGQSGPLSSADAPQQPASPQQEAVQQLVPAESPTNGQRPEVKLPHEQLLRVLVVDDEPINQAVMKSHLASEHYLVTSVMDGRQALEAIASDQQFDLVLLDVMMPHISGFEVCRKIREKYLPSELPIIMITAKNQVTDLVQGLDLGANDYIAKPFSRHELLARIKTQHKLLRINTAYGRFIPYEFLESLDKESVLDVGLDDYAEREATVLFSDIRDYTTLAEQMEPAENFRFLNAYLGRVGPVIHQHQGFVNQYYGDGIMALFMQGASDGVQAAIRMQQTIAGYNEERRRKGRQPISVGIGLHTGELVLGIMGDKKRLEAGVVSDTVNTAARMEGLTKHFGASVLVSEVCLRAMGELADEDYRYLGKVLVKGRKQPMGIYEFFAGDAPEVAALKRQSLEVFRAGMQAYYARDIRAAAESWEAVLKLNPHDYAARRMHQKTTELLQNGLPADWDGVEYMLSK
ncbi:MAG: response regulator [Bacteroidetes bacterium]|nr:MAG: response regulator [Bacteroidota bacterium]